MTLLDQVALVTGGGGGLGMATTALLAKAGAHVCVTFHSKRDEAEAACKTVKQAGRNSAYVHLDQSDPASVERAIGETVRKFGRLDILINNAGKARPVPFADLTALRPDIWDDLMQTNLRGPFLMTRAAAPHLRARKAGRVVNVGAMIGLTPAGSSIAQAVSKAGVIHLTRCLAVALAPDVTVNCVAPGLMEDTGMTHNLPSEYIQGIRKRSVLQRNAAIDDVAEQIIRFCQSNSITGQTVVIDGGIFFH
jgi:3-oxoacyl-[acyl-carrier protein] reductase